MNKIKQAMMNIFLRLCELAAAADAEVEGPEGSAPKTVEPLVFVVFKTDELVLQNPKCIFADKNLTLPKQVW